MAPFEPHQNHGVFHWLPAASCKGLQSTGTLASLNLFNCTAIASIAPIVALYSAVPY